MRERQAYPTDLTDYEWELIKDLVPGAKPGGRPEKYQKREIINGINYLARGGCVWRLLPHDLPPYRIVFHYFSQWRKDGTWQRINDKLRERVRLMSGKLAQPSAAIIDSQSVKTAEKRGTVVGMKPSKLKGVKGTFSSIR